ncbi:MAG: DeoR/GlpR family DNA-binding transcription regulator [Aeromonas sp.]|uniref:DeoR/GlpR family DNA-binding transcription regulator n=1 Tax=Aeromonas sp. TaxID=647 RepID=UPI002FC81D1D
MEKYSLEERQLLILDLLAAHHKVMAADLALQLGTTEATIRRDLRHLADEGRCKRIHGGAISLSPQTSTLTERSKNQVGEKQALALAALRIIKQDQLIFLDASSTHLSLAALLPEQLGLTVVTNSPAIAVRLLERKGIRTVLIGGELDYMVGGAVDITAAESINKFRFDLCFLGVCAWSSDLGFSAIHYQDSEFKRRVASRSGSLAVLCNDDKMESLASYPFLHSSELDYLICSRQDAVLMSHFEASGCTVITAG